MGKLRTEKSGQVIGHKALACPANTVKDNDLSILGQVLGNLP